MLSRSIDSFLTPEAVIDGDPKPKGTVLLERKIAPRLVYFVLVKELLRFSQTAPRSCYQG